MGLVTEIFIPNYQSLFFKSDSNSIKLIEFRETSNKHCPRVWQRQLQLNRFSLNHES